MEPGPAPAASVIVPSRGGAHRLPALIAALAAQRTSASWEVVVVLDGPDPDAEQVLADAPVGLALRIVRRPESTGVASALNSGYAAARGRVLIRCDDDLTPAPGMVARHLALHDGPDRVGIVGLTRDAFGESAYARGYGRPSNERALAAAYARPESHRWMHWAAHNSLTRETWDLVGGFDEAFAYREDSDLGLRLAQLGVPIVIDPDLEIEHRHPAPDVRTRAERAWVSGAAEVLFAQRHPELDAHAPEVPPVGVRSRVWTASTAATSAVARSRGAAGRLGRVVDAVLPHLPQGLAGSVVALVVEGSAQAGRRRGTRDQSAYRSLKDAELDGETGRD